MTRRLLILALVLLAAMLTRGRVWSYERCTAHARCRVVSVYLHGDEPVCRHLGGR